MRHDVIDAAHRRLEYLKRILDKVNGLRRDEPEGRLRISVRKGTKRMYCRMNADSKRDKYIPKGNSELAVRLAQKGFLEKTVKAINREAADLRKFVDDCDGNTFETVYCKLSAPRKEMVVPVAETDAMFAERWIRSPYVKKFFGDDSVSYTSKRGEKFRSKSEYIIAEELFSAGVPYKYECGVVLRDHTFYPDFTALNVERRKEFIWEHLGKMDDAGYAEAAVFKLNTYMAGGYYPGVNLLLTWETSRTPLDVDLVRDIIYRFLLG